MSQDSCHPPASMENFPMIKGCLFWSVCIGDALQRVSFYPHFLRPSAKHLLRPNLSSLVGRLQTRFSSLKTRTLRAILQNIYLLPQPPSGCPFQVLTEIRKPFTISSALYSSAHILVCKERREVVCSDTVSSAWPRRCSAEESLDCTLCISWRRSPTSSCTASILEVRAAWQAVMATITSDKPG